MTSTVPLACVGASVMRTLGCCVRLMEESTNAARVTEVARIVTSRCPRRASPPAVPGALRAYRNIEVGPLVPTWLMRWNRKNSLSNVKTSAPGVPRGPPRLTRYVRLPAGPSGSMDDPQKSSVPTSGDDTDVSSPDGEPSDAG